MNQLLPFVFTFLFSFSLGANETTTNLSNSFLPAAVQTVAYLVQQLEPLHGVNETLRGGQVLINQTTQGNSSIVIIEVLENVDKPRPQSYERLKKLLKALNKEAKKQRLEKYEGFSLEIMKQLEKSSTMVAAEQLKFVLEKTLLDNISDPVKNVVNDILKDLNNRKSRLYIELENTKPLKYLSYN